MLMALHSGPIASTRSRTGRPRKRSSCHPSASANRHADGWNPAQALLPHLIMPAHHDVQSSNVFAPRLRGPWLQRPSAVRRLSRSAGVGARTVRSLALYRFRDPTRISLARCGKDRHPFPVPIKIYDETIRVMKSAVRNAKLGRDEEMQALKRLDDQARRL